MTPVLIGVEGPSFGGFFSPKIEDKQLPGLNISIYRERYLYTYTYTIIHIHILVGGFNPSDKY